MTKNLICHMFGHKRDRGWYGDGLYGRVQLGGIDGVGRAHATIDAECDRCGQWYILARFHPNSSHILDYLARLAPEDLRRALDERSKT